ncbi:MAG: hypothetical protein ACRCX2_23135 [Paraclostridium sp.]
MDIKNKQAHYSYSAQPVKTIDNPETTKIGIGPLTIAGAITGALVGAHAGKKNTGDKYALPSKANMPKKPVLEGDYYKQVQNVAKNLRVIFTPMGAVFVLDNKGQAFSLDTIEISEMDEASKEAWKAKDEGFFKRMMILKMYSDMQAAEQKFSKIFLEKQAGITKKASSEDMFNECPEFEILAMAISSKDMYEKIGQENRDKIGLAIGDIMERYAGDEAIALKLDRPICKYASLKKDIAGCLGVSSTDSKSSKELARKLSNPYYVSRNIEIGFLPDRVVFLVDNILVSTMHVSDMDEQKFDNFKNENKKFFKSIFMNQCKQNMSKTASEDNEDTLSEAINYNLNEIFFKSDIHPVVYYLVLTNKYGFEWLKYDLSILEKIIRTGFGLDDDINIIAMDKIMAIHTANNSENVYKNAYCFEKITLSLCEKPVDFSTTTPELLNIDNIIYAIDVLDRVTPLDDIYDNFSPEVLSYICKVLSSNDIYIYNPSSIMSSPTEPAFNEMINEFLLRSMKRKMTKHADKLSERKRIEDKVEYIANTSESILKSIRRNLDSIDSSGLSKTIDLFVSKAGVKKDLSRMVKDQVMINLLVDTSLEDANNKLSVQIKSYNVTPGGGADE